MMYLGAADYYFWQGVKSGQDCSIYMNPDDMVPSFHMDNETTRACCEAFKWGFCLGQVLTIEEYQDLIKEPENAKEILQPADKSDEFDYKYEQPLGNC